MSPIKSAIAVSLCAMILSGCAQRRTDAERSSATADPDPARVPENITLAGAANHVLIVQLKVTADDVQVIAANESAGTPTSSIVQGRPFKIVAVDARGKIVQRISMDNPLEVRTVGSKDPKTAQLDSATVTIVLPDPQRVKSLRFRIDSGPGEGLKTEAPIAPRADEPATKPASD